MFYVRSTDGIKIAVYDYNPFGEETVVLIHGWPLSHLMYEYQTELLCRQGYRVVTLDLRGFGNSDTPAFEITAGTISAYYNTAAEAASPFQPVPSESGKSVAVHLRDHFLL